MSKKVIELEFKSEVDRDDFTKMINALRITDNETDAYVAKRALTSAYERKFGWGRANSGLLSRVFRGK